MNDILMSYGISILSLVIAGIVCFTGLRRNHTIDDKKESAEMTTVIVKLENISSSVNEIKSDVRNIRTEVQDLRERIVGVELLYEALQKRMDSFESRDKEA